MLGALSMINVMALIRIQRAKESWSFFSNSDKQKSKEKFHPKRQPGFPQRTSYLVPVLLRAPSRLALVVEREPQSPAPLLKVRRRWSERSKRPLCDGEPAQGLFWGGEGKRGGQTESHSPRTREERRGGGGTLRETRTIGKSFFATADRLWFQLFAVDVRGI